MPALNTPQFSWVKNRLKYKAQPVPPTFQPEVGARIIYRAAHHSRRKLTWAGQLSRRSSATRSHPAGLIVILAKLDSPPNKLLSQKIPVARTICGSRWRETTERTARSTVKPTSAVGKFGQASGDGGSAQVWRWSQLLCCSLQGADEFGPNPARQV